MLLSTTVPTNGRCICAGCNNPISSDAIAAFMLGTYIFHARACDHHIHLIGIGNIYAHQLRSIGDDYEIRLEPHPPAPIAAVYARLLQNC